MAAERFSKAGNSYLGAMLCAFHGAHNSMGEVGVDEVVAGEEASKAFLEARSMFVKMNDPIEERQALRSAAEALAHYDGKAAAKLIESELLPKLVDNGKFDEAGKLLMQVAQTCEEDDIDGALHHYNGAVDMFTSGGSESNAIKCKLRIAELAGEREDYDTAVRQFTEVAGMRLGKDLTKLQARTHFLDAGICLLAKGDTVDLRASLERWKVRLYSGPRNSGEQAGLSCEMLSRWKTIHSRRVASASC